MVTHVLRLGVIADLFGNSALIFPDEGASVSIGGEEVRLTQEQKEQILSWFRSDPSLCP